MPFNGKSGKFNAAIRTVEIGTGDKAVKLGGECVSPLYSFDAPIENAPKVGVLITDYGFETKLKESKHTMKDVQTGEKSLREQQLWKVQISSY